MRNAFLGSLIYPRFPSLILPQSSSPPFWNKTPPLYSLFVFAHSLSSLGIRLFSLLFFIISRHSFAEEDLILCILPPPNFTSFPPVFRTLLLVHVRHKSGYASPLGNLVSPWSVDLPRLVRFHLSPFRFFFLFTW